MLKKFAEELKEARIKSGISLQQIHFKTRIDIKFLEAIENGDFEILPEVYLRAIIREYATFIGLDDKAELYKYNLAKAGKPVDEEQSHKMKEERKESDYDKKNVVFAGVEEPPHSAPDDSAAKQYKVGPKFIFIFSVVLLLVIFIYLFFIKGSSNEIITERPSNTTLPEGKQRYEINETPANKGFSKEHFYSNKDSLTLLIKSIDTSWIGYKVDNRPSGRDFILYPNGQKRIKAARNFELTIGNSKSIELFLNERPLNFEGGYKEVKLIKIDSTGLSYLSPIKSKTSENE
jgi:transcriptional regulator with XRE-family HTH domain